MEWVEVRGPTVDVAVEAALEELGIDSVAEANIEVLEAPTKGFLGLGGKDALVRVEKKAAKSRRRRRRRPKGGQESRQSGQPKQDKSKSDRSGRSGKSDRSQSAQKSGKPRGDKPAKPKQQRPQERKPKQRKEPAMTENGEGSQASPEEQAEVVKDFLAGLVDSFGLEGEVTATVEDDLIIADVSGEQTEALVGPKGSIMQSVNEIVRTVVQRKTHQRARLRLDIGGYVERRREALRIYTARLAEQVLEEGGELMLEPMNPADRKVVHDAVVEIEGVRSFSEGEEPNRSVVIALAPGVEASAESDEEDSEE